MLSTPGMLDFLLSHYILSLKIEISLQDMTFSIFAMSHLLVSVKNTLSEVV